MTKTYFSLKKIMLMQRFFVILNLIEKNPDQIKINTNTRQDIDEIQKNTLSFFTYLIDQF